MKVHLTSAAALVALVTTALGGSAELVRIKSIYVTQVQKVEQQFRNDLLKMPQDHIRDLRDLEQYFQRLGDLKSLLAVREERVRFTQNPRKSDMVVVPAPQRLQALQTQYIKAYDDLSAGRDSRLKDLAEKYIRALGQLQRDLTQKGQIDDALDVMAEIERMKTVDVLDPNRAIHTQDGAGDAAQVSIEALRAVLRGHVAKWNSSTRQVVIEYDFENENQLEDWKGGALAEEGTALLAKNTIAWMRPQFESITEIHVDGHFVGDVKRTRFVIGNSTGNSVSVDLIDDGRPRCVVFQTSEHNPILTAEESLRTAIGNMHSVSIEGDHISLVVNFRKAHTAQLQTGLRFPAFVGVGCVESQSAYSDIKVVGVLSPSYVKYIAEQATH